MIRTFEDLTAWQKARAWCKEIYCLTAMGAFARDFGLRDQLRRSAVSVMSNLAEGFERGHCKELKQFVLVAQASCAEARSHLYVALDAGYLSEDQFNILMQAGTEIGRILGGLSKSLTKPLVTRRSSLST